MKLQTAVRICEAWCHVPLKLTTTFWPGAVEHQWKGPPHVDTFTQSFKARLAHILHIRTLSDEMFQLLPADERAQFQQLQLGKLFEPLEKTQPLLYNPYTDPAWQQAVREYDRAVDPIEAAVAQRFRRNTAGILDRPQLLLREFEKYRNLLERPGVRRSLLSEREVLLSLLRDLVKKMEAAVDKVEAGLEEDDDDGSSACSSIVPSPRRHCLLAAARCQGGGHDGYIQGHFERH